PSGMSLVRAQIAKKQAQALAIVSVFSSTSAAFGPTIGGFLIAEWSWPAIFLINLPLILIGFTLALLVLPKPTDVTFDRKRIDRKSTRLNSSHVSISYAVFCLK